MPLLDDWFMEISWDYFAHGDYCEYGPIRRSSQPPQNPESSFPNPFAAAGVWVRLSVQRCVFRIFEVFRREGQL